MLCVTYTASYEVSQATKFNSSPQIYDFLKTLRKKPVKNIVGKAENAGFHFLLYPQFFPTRVSIFSVIFILWSANICNLVQLKSFVGW